MRAWSIDFFPLLKTRLQSPVAKIASLFSFLLQYNEKNQSETFRGQKRTDACPAAVEKLDPEVSQRKKRLPRTVSTDRLPMLCVVRLSLSPSLGTGRDAK